MEEIDRQDEAEEKALKSGARKGGALPAKRRKTEKEEDAELVRNEKHGYVDTIFRESPPFIKNGTMRDYQVQGLNWLINLHENGISGILADEMGLGKTLQTISFIGYLRFICEITGPHLVVVPKSTLDNWSREFAKWIPEVNILILQGAKEERKKLIEERLITQDFDVLVTSYEMIMREKSHLKKFAWEYIIIDEAHRIKNEDSSLSNIVRTFNSRNRMLITGTPLQNNLHELWALLNFLLPDVFGESEAFDQWFSTQNEGEDSVVQQLHKILAPFLLRRVKADVEKSLLPKKESNLYVGMSEMQIKWYRKILEKDIDAVNGAGGKKESKTRLLNIVMQLRKCCNHPYLFEGAEPGPPYTTDEHLVDNSAKMVMFDRLLKRFKKNGDRVLIFSQMSRVLDILEDYSVMRGYQYCRIDGSTAHEDRIAAIDEYNKEDSEKFLFLLTTRAGGLGINLTSANIVILFDSDWNPQADLQAMDRAHRIGQKKQVYVYRFITENAIEEKVLERAAQKLRLDQLVIQQGRAQQPQNKAGGKDELLSMIQHGAEKVFAEGAAAKTADVTEDDIDAILKHGEQRTAELNQRYENLDLNELQNFKSDSAYEWNGQSFVPSKVNVGLNWINPSKRERKEQSYSMDKYYRQALQTGGRTAETRVRVPRAPKQIQIHDYQFFPEGLQELYDKENAWYRKENNIAAPLPEGEEEDLEQRKQDQELAQTEIDTAEPLTEEEQALKEEMLAQGFPEWNRRDFQQFINGSAKYGRTSFDSISTEVDGKETAEIKAYAKVFWKKYKTISGWERHVNVVEEGEARTRKVEEQKRLLAIKLKQYRNPLQQMKINYTVSTTNKKVYNEEEDRFLLVKLNEHGIDSTGIYEQLRDDIRESRLFRFDWFFLSRTPLEISRRCATLLTTVSREFEGGDARITNGKKRAKEEEEVEEEEEEPAKKKTKGSAAKVSICLHGENGGKLTYEQNKQIANVKRESKGGSGSPSRAESVVSNGSVPTKSKKGKKK